MTTVHRGSLLSFDAATWTALVLIDGADAEAQIPVGQWVPASMLVANTEVAVINFDHTNADDGLVIGPYGGPPLSTALVTIGGLNLGSASGAAAGQLIMQGTAADPLAVTVDGVPAGIVLQTYRANVSQSRLTARSARGSLATPGASSAGDILFGISANGYQTNTGAFGTQAPALRMLADEAWTNVAQGTRIELYATADGSTTPALVLTIGPGLKLGFFGVAAAARPTVTGSRAGNAALASLLTALAGLGLITDSTSA